MPRLGEYKGNAKSEEIKPLTKEEKKGLIYAGIGSVVLVAIVAWGLIPEQGFLRDPETFSVLHSPFMDGIIAFIFIGGAVFVPMLMLLGYAPEFTQVAYCAGDSVSNIVSPMMSYFALIIAFVHQYDKKAGVGTLIATMLPYSVVFMIIWTILLIVWVTLDIPIGSGSPLYYMQ